MRNLLRRLNVPGYAAALGSVALALVIRWALQPFLGEHAPMMLFMLPPIVAALVGGLGPGLVAMVCGELIGDYFFVHPYHTLGPTNRVEWTYCITFLLETGACVGVIEALRRARGRAARSQVLAQSRGEQLRTTIREINEAEAKIQELAAVVRTAQDAIVSVSLDGVVKSWNLGSEKLFGYTAAEMVGAPLSRIIPPDRQSELESTRQKLEGGERLEAFETTRLTKDRGTIWVSVRLSPMHDSEGRLVGTSAITRDITELKRATAALRESERRFHVLADATPLMVRLMDAQQQCSWVNRTWLEFSGRELKAEVRGGWLELVHAEDKALVTRGLAGAYERREPYQLEYRLRRNDGEYRWLLDHGVPHFGADGEFLGFLGSGIDVTERNQAEQALEAKYDELRSTQERLREQNQQLASNRQALEAERSRYRELFDSAPIGYILTSRQGVIQQVNRAAALLLNETPEFLAGFPLARLVVKEDRAVFFANIGRLTRRELPQLENWETRLQPHGRTPFPCSVAVNLVQDDSSRLSGLRWILRDITDRKQAEEKVMRLIAELEQRVRERTAELQAANRELEAFSYSVSHDLRAPLRSINGFSRALQEEYGERLDEQGLKYLQYAQEAALRMSRLIDDLLELSRATRGELREQEVDLGGLATLVLAELHKRDPRRAVRIKVSPALKTYGDEGLLRIALENLLSNAWKFTARTSHAAIEVGEQRRNGGRTFYVRDNGAGFNMANANRLFGVFQRLHSQEEFPGTGVGLATVRRIMHRHGGEIWAEGKPDAGATFYFTLREANPSPREVREAVASIPTSRGVHPAENAPGRPG